MKKAFKKVLKIILTAIGSLAALAVIVLAVAALLFFFHKNLVKNIAEKIITNKTGVQVKIGRLDYKLSPLRVELYSVKASIKVAETKIDIFLDHMTAKGDIHRVRKKQKPYLDTVEIEGLQASAAIKMAGKKIELQPILHSLSRGLSYVQKIHVSRSSFDFFFSSQNIRLHDIELSLAHPIKTGEPVPVIHKAQPLEDFDFSLRCEDISGKFDSPTKATFHCGLRSSGVLGIGALPFIDGRFALTSPAAVLLDKAVNLQEIALRLRGELSLEGSSLSLPLLELDVPSLLSVAGPLRIDFSKGTAFAFQPKVEIRNLKNVMEFLKPYAPAGFINRLTLRGSALAEGDVRSSSEAHERKTDIKADLTLDLPQIRYSTSGYAGQSAISARFKLNGTLRSLDVSGRVRIKGGRFSQKDLDIRGISLDIPLDNKHDASLIRISRLKGSFDAVNFAFKGRGLAFPKTAFLGSLGLDLARRRILPLILDVHVESLPPVHIEAKAGLNPRAEKWFRFQSSGIASSSLISLFSPFIPPGISEWEPEGLFSFALEARTLAKTGGSRERWDVSGNFGIHSAKFHNPSLTLAAEGLQSQVNIRGEFAPPFDRIPFFLGFSLMGGETLFKDYYLNWQKLPLKAKAEGLFSPPSKQLSGLKADAVISPLGRLNVQGSMEIRSPLFTSLEVAASELDLASLYAFTKSGLSADELPFAVEGKAESGFRLNHRNGVLSASGRLRVSGASFAAKNGGVSFKGIETDIPFDLARGVDEHNGSAALEADRTHPLEGFVRIKDIRSHDFSLISFKVDIRSVQNGFQVSPLSLDLFGGRLSIGRASLLFDLNRGSFTGVSSLELSACDLKKFPVESKKIQLSGMAAANLPRVELSTDTLETEGAAELEMFGGKISVSNIKVEQPFSKNRTIFCDIDFAGLNMEKLTDSLPLGRITGIINGEVKDLSIAYGQPESFTLRVESEKRKGIPQKFSLKAANDLAIIGSGEKTSLSAKKGWTRFVSDFRYAKIGILCSLKNDRFTLRGTIHHKGVEYLVKNSWIFGISVVNKKPQNKISFKDMVSRLKRISR